MLGKQIRSIRHLVREIGDSFRYVIINRDRDYDYELCKAIKLDKFASTKSETLFVFNNAFSYGDVKPKLIHSHPKLREMESEYSEVFVISNMSAESVVLSGELNNITLLPESFDEDYHKFVKTNYKTFEPLFNKYCLSERSHSLKILYSLTGNSKNFFVWGVNLLFKQSIPMYIIERILYWNENYRQLVKNLSKSTITAYTSRESIRQLLDEMCYIRRDKRINDTINLFNTAQKKLIRNNLKEEDKDVIASFHRLSQTKKINFIQKVSTINSYDELMRMMRHVTSSHFSWDKKSFLDSLENVENLNYKIVVNNGNTVALKVNDFETVKYLAKTTNWCISKNKTYWNSYVTLRDNTSQYMVFDFSKEEDSETSIVGFTCKKNESIVNAHSFSNANMLFDNEIDNSFFINSFLPDMDNKGSIYSFLEAHNLNLLDFVEFKKQPYDWNRESALKYLHKYVDDESIRVLKDDGKLLALLVDDEELVHFIGGEYENLEIYHTHISKHILFMDFSLPETDPNRIMFAPIKKDCNEEERPIFFLNSLMSDPKISFNCTLTKFGLPYDTIKRTNDLVKRFVYAIDDNNIPELNNLLKKGNIKKKLFDNDEFGIAGAFSDAIVKFATEYASFDYLDAVYNNGRKLTELFGINITTLVISKITRQLLRTYYNKEYPTEEDIDNFFNKRIADADNVKFICMILSLEKICSHEIGRNKKNNEKICKELIYSMHLLGYSGTLIQKFILMAFNGMKDIAECDMEFKNLFAHYAAILKLETVNA